MSKLNGSRRWGAPAVRKFSLKFPGIDLQRDIISSANSFGTPLGTVLGGARTGRKRTAGSDDGHDSNSSSNEIARRAGRCRWG